MRKAGKAQNVENEIELQPKRSRAKPKMSTVKYLHPEMSRAKPKISRVKLVCLKCKSADLQTGRLQQSCSFSLAG